ncbi:MAG TPA: glycoside hydrolase family 3 N-terminal domain-containing protein [Acidimicrobiales bacterium]|nr:glycoside hydrolase family 3 N-terminal domain-containing protein [Acidimicrobiales bacterium]
MKTAAFAVVAVLVAAACSSSPRTAGRSAKATPVHSASWPSTSPCRPAPLADRAAQVLIAGLAGVTTSADPLVDELVDVGVGGVFVARANVTSEAQITALLGDVRARSHHPLVVATDEEGGRVSSFAPVLGPSLSARRQAGEHSPEEVRQLARQTGSRLAAAGVNLDLAPVADLDAGPSRATIGDRSFSADPAIASRYALAQAAGLADAGVRSAVKHFPGHGRSVGDPEVTRSRVDAPLAELAATDLLPFGSLITAGVPVVMVNHVEYAAIDPGVPASLSPLAYKLLRDVGFRGVAITDSVSMGAVNGRWTVAEATVKAVAAGADGVLVTEGGSAREMRDALVTAVQQGRLAEDRLDQAAARMAALGGVDPVALACQTAEVPRLAGLAR